MEVERTLSVDELFEKIRDYDLVFTTEASLMDALNVRIEKPVFQPPATTPKIHILKKHQNQGLLGERELFIQIARETDIPWKKASHILENIIECWKNTGSPENIKRYGIFEQETLEKILKVINSTDNIFSCMSEAEVDEELDVAVVNFHQFNELDKKVLPQKYDKIEVFKPGKKVLPSFKLFESRNEIIRAVKNNINQDNALDVAVVVEIGSPYSALIKSALKSKNISVMRRKELSEDENLRTFISFLRLSTSAGKTKLGNCQPVMRKLGIHISVEKNEKYIENVENQEVEEFRDLLESTEDSTVGEALENIEKYTRTNLKREFKKLGIMGEKVSSELVNRLEYYLNTYTVETDSSGRGVLIADAKSSAYIDRPIIFYIGMDMGWVPEISEKPWINRDKEEETGFKNFKALIQNGEQQHFLVQNSSVDGEITPCIYINELVEKQFETFRDLEHEGYNSEKTGERHGFERKGFRTRINHVDKISKSSLDKLVKSPKEYLFNKLTETTENQHLAKGNILHDFAEFYVNHTEFVEEKGDQVFVDLMLEKMKSFLEPNELDILETKFYMAVERIKRFLEKYLQEEIDTEGFRHVDFHGKNVFAEKFNREIDRDITEVWFSDRELGMKGKVDLLLDTHHLVDYKTGNMKKAYEVIENSCIQVLEGEPNFQALMYLSYLRKKRQEKRLEFTFFHVFENLDGEISGGSSIEEDLVNIRYHPISFKKFVETRDMFDFIMRKKNGEEKVSESNDRRKTLEIRMGYEDYKEFFEENSVPFRFEKDGIEDSEFLEKFIQFCSQRIGERYSYVEKGCESALKRIVDYGKSNYFKQDLDKFEDFVEKQLKLLNSFMKKGFPVDNPEVEIDIEDVRLYMEDLIPK